MRNGSIVTFFAFQVAASSLAEAQPAPPVVQNLPPPSSAPVVQNLPPSSPVPAAGAQPAAPSDAARAGSAQVVEVGPLELALQLGGNMMWAEVGEVTFWVPTVEVGAWLGTAIARDSLFSAALGYHFRGAKAPAELQHRHLASLALVRPDGAIFLDVGPGFLHDSAGPGFTMISFGCTVQAKLFGSGFSLVVPFYGDVLLGAEVPAWVTFGIGIGYTTL